MINDAAEANTWYKQLTTLKNVREVKNVSLKTLIEYNTLFIPTTDGKVCQGIVYFSFHTPPSKFSGLFSNIEPDGFLILIIW